MNGFNDKENLVSLTAREHCMVHKLLWKTYKTKNLFDAYFMMAHTRKGKRDFELTFREYEILKVESSIIQKKYYEDNPECAKEISKKLKKLYEENPYLRLLASLRQKKIMSDKELRKQITQKS